MTSSAETYTPVEIKEHPSIWKRYERFFDLCSPR